jgi:hypothetical protein
VNVDGAPIPERAWAAVQEALAGSGLGGAIGAEEDFFDAGGTSVGAALIAFRLDLSMVDVYQQRTVRRLARLLAGAAGAAGGQRAEEAAEAKAAERLRLGEEAAALTLRTQSGAAAAESSAADRSARVRCSFSRGGGFHEHCGGDGGGGGEGRRSTAAPVHTPRSLHTVWRVGLGKCIDASPLLLLDAERKSSVIVASHAGAASVLSAQTPLRCTNISVR